MNFKLYIKQLVALSIIMLTVPVTSTQSDESSCMPLPVEERFSVAGYQIGICKSEIEEILKVKDHKSAEDQSFSYETSYKTWEEDLRKDIMRGLLDSQNPKSVSVIVTNYIEASAPYENLLKRKPLVVLSFYNNTLSSIGIIYTYVGGVNADKFPSIYNQFENYMDKKYNALNNKQNKNYTSKEWVKGETRIVLTSDTTQKEITVTYMNSQLTEKYENDLSEEKRKQEEIDKHMEGF